jgi:hypothetical protein
MLPNFPYSGIRFFLSSLSRSPATPALRTYCGATGIVAGAGAVLNTSPGESDRSLSAAMATLYALGWFFPTGSNSTVRNELEDLSNRCLAAPLAGRFSGHGA